MPEFQFQEMFPHGEDTTSYRKLSSDHVGVTKFNGRDVLTVEPEALTMLTAQAFHDISHLLRPGHLAQLRSILDDGEASANDKYVALELLKNANIAAGGRAAGGAATSAFSPALSLRSNCRPKRTDGSTKAESAANGTRMRSCCLLKLTVTSKWFGPRIRSQYWSWSTIVISSGYLARK